MMTLMTPWGSLEWRGHSDTAELMATSVHCDTLWPHGTTETIRAFQGPLEPSTAGPHGIKDIIVTVWASWDQAAILTLQDQGVHCYTMEPHGSKNSCNSTGSHGNKDPL